MYKIAPCSIVKQGAIWYYIKIAINYIRGNDLKILDKIHNSNDIKKLTEDELEPLCGELREEIIEGVSVTGGHLASNLGAVELTVALHRVYDTSRDRIVFDVGHQCYAHKIITGRRSEFGTLRQYGGISGFPKPHESSDDAFIAGHASNSVAVALGMARARTLRNEDYDVAAIIGDGAMTGGLAYEGLANVGGSREPIVIILNDNGMSINSNVGGMSELLSKARVRPEYLEFKRAYRETIGLVKPLYDFNHKVKESIKKRILPGNMFDDLGLYYLGPIDGHDVRQLETAIAWARDMRIPVLLHVITVKGKGCSYAENDPSKYHGVGAFDAKTGILKPSGVCFSQVMGEELCSLAENDRNIVAITAAMSGGTGLSDFALKYPYRFFDAGIAEGSAVSMASGMAKQGIIPVFAVYSSFLQRGYDMLIHDAALQNLHIVLCVDRAGIVGSDGETHHGVFDVGYLSTVPGMTILCPSDFDELRKMLRKAVYDIRGPVAVRYPRGGEPPKLDAASHGAAEKAQVTIAAYGTMIYQARLAAQLLKVDGIDADVIKLDCVCPLDPAPVLSSVMKTGRLITAEEVCSAGCVGEKLLAAAASEGILLKSARLINLGNGILPQGTTAELMKDSGIDAAAIAGAAMEML
jgi:1-deoxy-D-xylulose-5-phosphate synthase